MKKEPLDIKWKSNAQNKMQNILRENNRMAKQVNIKVLI